VDYNMDRKADDMASFSLDLMPSFVERIVGVDEFTKFKNKAAKYALPMVLFFSDDRRVMNEMKFLSTEFRRRVLVAQIPLTKKENRNISFEYGVRGRALLVIPPQDGEVVTFDGKWSFRRLQSFFSEHALKEEVKPKQPTDNKAEQGKSQESEELKVKKEQVKVEL
jgi:hypothetical protein